MKRYDLAILGGGTAGLVAAVGAAAAGGRVVLVERERTGGDCLWTGCVPSKALIAAARTAHNARTAGRHGVSTGEVTVDFAKVMQGVRGAQQAIEHHDSVDRLERLGVEVVIGEGHFTTPHTLMVGERALTFRRALVATGARPRLPSIDGLREAEPRTTDTIWDLDRLPPRLTVLGGGAIGVELGQAFARLGSKVTIVEMEDRLLPREEPEASAVVEAQLRAEGVEVLTSTTATRVARIPTKSGVVHINGPDGEDAVAFDRMLVATGRQPNSEGIGLDTLAVARTRHGHIVVDEQMRTTARTIFAAGDVVDRPPFTHVAGMDASVVMTNALFGLRRQRQERVLWTTFTDPEVGRVGLTEAQARLTYGETVTARTEQHADLDRAIVEGRTEGFTKLVTDHDGKIVGGTAVGPHGGETAATIDAWIRSGATLEDLGQAMHAYPTWSEAIQHVGVQALRHTWDQPPRRKLMRPALGAARMMDRLRP